MKIHLLYYAQMKDIRGVSEETVETSSTNPDELFEELNEKHHFGCDRKSLRVAVNHEFSSWDTPLKEKDTVIFIPPVSGG